MFTDMTTEIGILVDALRGLVLAKVDAYQGATGAADSTISRHAVSESEFVARLRRGDNVTLDKIRRLEKWLNLHPAVAAQLLAHHSLVALCLPPARSELR